MSSVTIKLSSVDFDNQVALTTAYLKTLSSWFELVQRGLEFKPKVGINSILASTYMFICLG